MQIFFLLKTVKLNLVILTYLKWRKMVFYTHKQEHRTMPAHKFGKINLMIQSLTFGLLVVLSMKWPPYNHLLKQKIWRDFFQLLLLESILQLTPNTPNNLLISSNLCYNKNLNPDQVLKKYSLPISFKRKYKNSKCWILLIPN